VHATDRPVLGEPALASGLVELPSACRALRPGDALEDGRADPATESICGTQVSHLLIINPLARRPAGRKHRRHRRQALYWHAAWPGLTGARRWPPA